MVIEFGYLTLFASAYPLACAIAVVAHEVEVRSDCIQIARVFRKPRVVRTDNIGTWNMLLTCIVWLSALTNCLLFGYSSGQMMQWFPSFFYIDSDGEEEFAQNKGWIVVFIVFGFERFLLCCGLLFNVLIPKVPEIILDKVEHRNYLKSQEARKLRLLQKTSESDKDCKEDDIFNEMSMLSR